MGIARAAVPLAVAILAWVAGCGSNHPPAAGDGSGGTTPPSTVGLGGDGGLLLPGCGKQSDGSSCDCIDAPLVLLPPNLYFVIDRSTSMLEDNKWEAMVEAMTRVTREVGSRANFGAMIYPGSDTDACNDGKEIFATRAGDPPNTTDNGPTTNAFLSEISKWGPHGSTPTAAALRVALTNIAPLPGDTYVLLATDGGPNCNPNATCDVSACNNNIESAGGCTPTGPSCCEQPKGDATGCLDSQPTIAAATALAQAGHRVYVMGIPGSQPYASLLDQVAAAGGTTSYYRVDASSQDALLAGLKTIAAKIVATCSFKLKDAPPDESLVNVYFDEKVVPKDPANGWTISGANVTLVGDACAKVTSGAVLDVRIIVGCPSVVH
jgi:hypothetical protein